MEYSKYWNESDKEVWKAAIGGEPGSNDFEYLKLLLETRNAERVARFTNGLKWATIVLAIFTAVQVVLVGLNVYREIVRDTSEVQVQEESLEDGV